LICWVASLCPWVLEIVNAATILALRIEFRVANTLMRY